MTTNKNPPNHLIEAIKLVKHGTGEHFYMWNLSGGGNAKLRARIMSLLLGVKTPQSKSGINAIIAELYRQCGITGDCGAHRDRNFAVYAKGVLGCPELTGSDDYRIGTDPRDADMFEDAERGDSEPKQDEYLVGIMAKMKQETDR